MRFLLIIAAMLSTSLSGFSQQYYLFVGTYTEGPFYNGTSKGIYVYKWNGSNGDLTPMSSIATDNPSYLAVAPGGRFLYAVGETDGNKPGTVSAFAFNKHTGQLKLLNTQPSGGDDPCYVSVDEHRRWLTVANYSGGSWSAFPIKLDGTLAPSVQFDQHTGNGPDKDRQEKAHVHSTILSPDEKYLFVCDLGMDRVSVLRFNPASLKRPFAAVPDSIIALEPGSGPRHVVFAPEKPFVYVISELSGTVNAYHFADGKAKEIQRISTVPEGFSGGIGSADIHITPNGRFLYASNRGDANNLAIYAIDPVSGKLQLKGFQNTGKGPRNFMIDPSGHWVLVANQYSKNIIQFRIDQETGLLTPAGTIVELPAPVCLKMATID